MLTGLKNFAINKVLRHIADNPKLNRSTNLLAIISVVLYATLEGNANWMLMFSCCDAPGSVQEVTRVAGVAIMAALLGMCGKWSWLKQWLPVAEDILSETAKELSAAAKAPEKKQR